VSTYKELSANDFKSATVSLEQIIDIIQEDISGSSSRKSYQHFVTGGIGPGVTSSLWQTIYDQDFSLQTANPVFDMTIGVYVSSSAVQDNKTGDDSSGKILFPSRTLMMREKVDIYEQYAQTLLGSNASQFRAPFNSSDSSNDIDYALFMNFNRLFHRDSLKRETFAMQWYQSASVSSDGSNGRPNNLVVTSERGLKIYTDANSAANKEQTFGGNVGNLVDSSDTSRNVGLLFYDQGIAVFDLEKILSGSEHAHGVISAMSNASTGSAGAQQNASAGQTIIGGGNNTQAKFIPDLLVSGSIDDIVDHLASARMSSGTNSGVVFQNLTNIHSSLVFCRAEADEFNYSSNPTYIDSNNRIVVIDEGQEENQQSFTMISSLGLYDANNSLLAVAKLSRPVEKNPEKDITLRIRLDF